MKRLAIAERYKREKWTVGRRECERGLRQRQGRELVERVLRIDEILIVDLDQFLSESSIVMKIFRKGAVQGNKRLDKRESQIVAGDQRKRVLIVQVI